MNMSSMEARRILGLDSNASADEIKKAYRRLAAKHHPDKGGDASEFAKIKQAYDRLTQSNQGSPRVNYSNEDDAQSFWDYFGRMRNPNEQYFRTRHVILEISAYEAFAGTTRSVKIETGSTSSRIINVTINPGSLPGQIIDTISDEDGNVYIIQLAIQRPSNFSIRFNDEYGRQTGDIIMDITVSVFTMMSGGFIKVECPLDNSSIQVRIVAGAQAHSKLKVRGKGFWTDYAAGQRGNMILTLIPEIKPINQYCDYDVKSFITNYVESKELNQDDREKFLSFLGE